MDWRCARGRIRRTSEISTTPVTLNISLRDSVDHNIQSVTAGSFGYNRLLSYGSVKVGGGSLLYAGEFNTENGPWDTAEDLRKFSGLVRYTQGTATDGHFSDRDGVRQLLEFQRPDRAARHHDRTDWSFRRDRSH